jgi:hypothetical protein
MSDMTGKVALVHRRLARNRARHGTAALALARRRRRAFTGTRDDTLSAACRDLEREAAGRVLALRADVRSAPT